MGLSRHETRRRLVAYRATRTDREAAQRLGLKRMTFALWRIRHRLPAKGVGLHPGRPLPPHEVARRRRALETSGSLREAARRLGVGFSPLYRFMKRYGISNPRLRLREQRRREMTRLARAGRSLRQIARSYRVSYATVYEALRSPAAAGRKR